ncbi:hypothetical protein B0H14DRAFT_3507668 [Mycena olivaceomarginata]|nr:hypothetical protein B0H14DRAFT_3507668 [Mycena olivaceomarginata]
MPIDSWEPLSLVVSIWVGVPGPSWLIGPHHREHQHIGSGIPSAKFHRKRSVAAAGVECADGTTIGCEHTSTELVETARGERVWLAIKKVGLWNLVEEAILEHPDEEGAGVYTSEDEADLENLEQVLNLNEPPDDETEAVKDAELVPELHCINCQERLG